MHAPTSPNGTHPNGHTSIPNPPPGPDAKPQAADGGRDAHGRFAKGNLGGPGNPFARQVAALRRALLATVSDEDMEAVAQELVRQAKEGNLAAAKLLLSYTLGKPAAAVDPDTLDQQEWDNYRRVPDPGPDLGAMAGRMPLSFACEVTRAMLPALARDWTRQWADAFRRNEPEPLSEFEAQLEAAAREERAARRKAKAERRRQGPPAQSAAARPEDIGKDHRDQAPAGEAEALDLLARLLGMAPGAGGAPSANGGAASATPCQVVPPPSPNGGASADKRRD